MKVKNFKSDYSRSSDHSALPYKSKQSTVLLLVLFVIAPGSAFHMARRPEHQSGVALARTVGTAFYGGSAFSKKENGSGMARSSHKTVSTRLQYRDADEEDSIEMRAEQKAAVTTTVSQQPRWWLTWFPVNEPVARSQDASSQEVVDDYLEFLDKRYHRLHDDEQTPREAKFSAWNWLKQGSNANKAFTQKEESDALYVLGVAGLASERLLQKHQPGARSASEADAESVATTAVDVEVVPTPKLAVVLALVLRKVSPVATLLALSRRALVRYQTRKTRQLGGVVARALFVAPTRLGSALLNFSGGKRNLACTATVATAFTFFIVRSLIKVALSEGASVSATTGV